MAYLFVHFTGEDENGEEIYFVKTPALGLWKVD